MANAPNAKANAVRLDRERPRNFRTANSSSRWPWITWGMLSGFVGILLASAASAPCATFDRATALRSANTAMSTLARAHHEPDARGRSAEPGSTDATAPADLRSETTAIEWPAARRPAGDRPLAGPMVSLTPEPIIEARKLLGANAPDLSTDELANKVLVQGEAVAAPAGRADNFSWPRRGIVSSRRHPEIATNEPPRTPNVVEKSNACPQPSDDDASLISANAFPATARKPTCSAVKP
jgi:hypothetical protein